MTYNVFSGMLNPTQSINQPFGHNTPMLQTGQDRQDRTYRQQSNSIGRTINHLANSRPKTKARFSRLWPHPASKWRQPILIFSAS